MIEKSACVHQLDCYSTDSLKTCGKFPYKFADLTRPLFTNMMDREAAGLINIELGV